MKRASTNYKVARGSHIKAVPDALNVQLVRRQARVMPKLKH